jgi:hypothetical protein
MNNLWLAMGPPFVTMQWFMVYKTFRTLSFCSKETPVFLFPI